MMDDLTDGVLKQKACHGPRDCRHDAEIEAQNARFYSKLLVRNSHGGESIDVRCLLEKTCDVTTWRHY